MARTARRRGGRERRSRTIYTIGYQRRTADELISLLKQAGVECLVDVRANPNSRRAEFRPAALRELCRRAGLRYEPFPELGSTPAQRAALLATGDASSFRRRYRAYVQRYKRPALARLATHAHSTTIALLCYERNHDRCHRSIVAELVADQLQATLAPV